MQVLLPISIYVLSRYITYLFLRGCSLSMIKSHLAVIKYAHAVRNLYCPTSAPVIARLIKGVKSNQIPAVKIKPINCKLLHKLLSTSRKVLNDYDTYLFNAIASFLYCGNLRIGELLFSGDSQHSVVFDCVKWVVKNGTIQGVLLILTSYKHSGNQIAKIYMPRRRNQIICPVCNIDAYILVRPRVSPFLFIDKEGRLVTATWFLSNLRQVLQILGLNPGSFSTHSFRIGYTSDTAMAGSSYPQLQLRGRWKSMAFQKYMRPDVIVM